MKLRAETSVVLARHCWSCALCVALVDSVERGKHGVGASVVAFRLFVGACSQCTSSTSCELLAFDVDHVHTPLMGSSIGLRIIQETIFGFHTK